MNRMITLLCLLAIGVFGAVVLRTGGAGRNSPKQIPLPGPNAADINALNRVLFELAAERHAVHKNRHETWILTMHNGRDIKKFTDGSCSVLALPNAEPQIIVGLCTYIRQYNSFTENEADEMVRSGKYDEAGKLYELLVRLDLCGGLAQENLAMKLTYIKQLQSGDDPEASRRKLLGLCVELESHLRLAEIDTIPTTTVTNLLKLRGHITN